MAKIIRAYYISKKYIQPGTIFRVYYFLAAWYIGNYYNKYSICNLIHIWDCNLSNKRIGVYLTKIIEIVFSYILIYGFFTSIFINGVSIFGIFTSVTFIRYVDSPEYLHYLKVWVQTQLNFRYYSADLLNFINYSGYYLLFPLLCYL